MSQLLSAVDSRGYSPDTSPSKSLYLYFRNFLERSVIIFNNHLVIIIIGIKHGMDDNIGNSEVLRRK